MGELLNYYACADVAFVGGSLVQVGGHNLLEPAALGVATLCGPHMFSTQDTFEKLRTAGAVRCVASEAELGQALVELAATPQVRVSLVNRAREVVIENRGAVQRVLDLVKLASA
jgi:3-deoxy-D-manno-octulosonic-acid transferase